MSKINSNLWFRLIRLCLFIFFILLITPAIYNIVNYKLPAQLTLISFMKKMYSKDFEQAYSLYYDETRQKLQLTDLELMAQENNFEDYRSLSFRHFKLLAALSGHPELPPLTAEIDGFIFYRDNTTRFYKAVLVMENDKWEIESLEINTTINMP